MTIMQMYYLEKDLEEGSVGWNIVRWITRRTVRCKNELSITDFKCILSIVIFHQAW